MHKSPPRQTNGESSLHPLKKYAGQFKKLEHVPETDHVLAAKIEEGRKTTFLALCSFWPSLQSLHELYPSVKDGRRPPSKTFYDFADISKDKTSLNKHLDQITEAFIHYERIFSSRTLTGSPATMRDPLQDKPKNELLGALSILFPRDEVLNAIVDELSHLPEEQTYDQSKKSGLTTGERQNIILLARDGLRLIEDNKRKLVQKCLPFVPAMIHRCTQDFSLTPDWYGEIVSDVYLALYQAAARYNHHKGYYFKTMAERRVNGVVKDFFKNKVRENGGKTHTRALTNRIHTAQDDLTAELERPPTIAEIAERAKMPIREIDHLLAEARHINGKHTSLNSADETGCDALIDRLPNVKVKTPLEEVLLKEEIGLLQSAMQRLEPNELAVVILHAVEEKTLDEISVSLGRTPSRASQHWGSARKKLKAYRTQQYGQPITHDFV